MDENISDKLSISIHEVDLDRFPEHEFMVALKDFEKRVMAMMFFSLIFCLFILIL